MKREEIKRQDGSTIYNALRRQQPPVTVAVEGMNASAAAFVAMGATESTEETERTTEL